MNCDAVMIGTCPEHGGVVQMIDVRCVPAPAGATTHEAPDGGSYWCRPVGVNSGSYHWRDGWHFARMQDGSVQIYVGEASARGPMKVYAVIPYHEWVSIVHAVADRSADFYAISLALSGQPADARGRSMGADWRALVEELDRRLIRYSEDEHGMIAFYMMAAGHWHKLLAAARAGDSHGHDNSHGCVSDSCVEMLREYAAVDYDDKPRGAVLRPSDCRAILAALRTQAAARTEERAAQSTPEGGVTGAQD